jgi:molybdate transport system regulatory protein
MEPRVKVWLEKDGKVVLGGYRAELLRQIEACGSLSEAAKRMRLSYRRAWGKIRELEENLGARLIESEHGGADGGGSRLTPEGQRLIALFERLSAATDEHVQREFAAIVADDRTADAAGAVKATTQAAGRRSRAPATAGSKGRRK